MKPGAFCAAARIGVLGALAVGVFGCGAGRYDTAALLKFRAEKDSRMQGAAPLKYFAPDPSWVFQSKLEPYPNPEHVRILDTKAQPIEADVVGFLTFRKGVQDYTLRVYKVPGPIRGTYLHAIWFTDRTTGDSTYEVGRYLDFVNLEDPGHVYTIDFNRAYNPLCAYSSAYACPIPRKEDHLDLAITAGEKKWHD